MNEINQHLPWQLKTEIIWKYLLLKKKAWKTVHGVPFPFFSFTFNFFPCSLKLTPHPKGPTQAIKLNDVPDSSVDQ